MRAAKQRWPRESKGRGPGVNRCRNFLIVLPATQYARLQPEEGSGLEQGPDPDDDESGPGQVVEILFIDRVGDQAPCQDTNPGCHNQGQGSPCKNSELADLLVRGKEQRGQLRLVPKLGDKDCDKDSGQYLQIHGHLVVLLCAAAFPVYDTQDSGSSMENVDFLCL